MKKSIRFPAITAFILALSFLAGGLGAQEPSSDFPLRKRQTTDGFRIVTANLRQIMKDDEKTGNGWEDRRIICREIIVAQNADIYCLQENRNEISDYLLKELPGFAFSNTIYRSKQPINAILYSTKRFEKIQEGGFWLSPTPDVENSKFPGATRRVANWILLKDKITGKPLCVVNAHYTHDSEQARLLQIEVTLNFTKTIPKNVPAIMTADFNCGMESKPIAKALAVGWIDSYTTVHGPADPGGTAHRFLGEKVAKTRKKIDHILHTNLLKSVAAEVIKDNYKGRYPSDHYFVSAELVYVK